MKYWEEEIPVVVETDKNVLSWYPEAGKLQVANPCWYDDDGRQRVGKTVVIDMEALMKSGNLHQATGIFKEILTRLEG